MSQAGSNDLDHQILALVAGGRTNREIGHQLFLAEITVAHRLTRLMRRYQARNRAHLTYRATCLGVLDPDDLNHCACE
jgi:DNA-binding NarL/FixJ family response regulator